jgi:hypothetical protein
LNVILKDRLKLEKKNFIYVNREDTTIKDTIHVGRIRLVEKSDTDIFVDSTKRYFMIFFHDFSLKENYRFQIPADKLIQRINNLKESTWDKNKITVNIPIEKNFEKYNLSSFDSIFIKRSYLIISEPLFFEKNKILVSAILFNYQYSMDKVYEMERVNGIWKINHSGTIITKEVIDNKNIKVPDDDEFEYVESRYQIFVGYSNEL